MKAAAVGGALLRRVAHGQACAGRVAHGQACAGINVTKWAFQFVEDEELRKNMGFTGFRKMLLVS